MRTPLSKQRNKHIQRVLVDRENHDLALVYESEKQKGNAHRATLAVARGRWSICWPWTGGNGISCLQKSQECGGLAAAGSRVE
jgi:hypothetical protein